MQIVIPIKQLESEKCGSEDGVWDRLCDSRGFPALEFWCRHEYSLEHHHPAKWPNIPPDDVQLGHGDMLLDEWMEPDELIGTGCQVQPKPLFEVKLHVSDYRPEELRVTLREDRLLTIDGQHDQHPHEDSNGDDDGGHHRHGSRLHPLGAHFKRSVTLPETVLERPMQCSLTSDGRQLVLSAPVRPTARVTDAA